MTRYLAINLNEKPMYAGMMVVSVTSADVIAPTSYSLQVTLHIFIDLKRSFSCASSNEHEFYCI